MSSTPGAGHVAIELSPIAQPARVSQDTDASTAPTTAGQPAPAAANAPGRVGGAHLAMPPPTTPSALVVGTPSLGTGAPALAAAAKMTSSVISVAGKGVDAVADTLSSPMSKLAKLQTYLPTGTWITFTALQTWAFSIRPNEPPPVSADPAHQSNCNVHQRIALAMVIGLGVFVSFASSFIKTFVMDSSGKRILYPAPSGAYVPHTVKDAMTGVEFPCHTQHKQLWPVSGPNGQWIRDGRYLKVMVFKKGVEVVVRGGPVFARMLNTVQNLKSTNLIAKTEQDDPSFRMPFQPTPNASIDTFFDPQVPMPEPRWRFTLKGPQHQYLDFSSQVWMHAFVSVGAFSILALFSTQVTKCIYADIPDYLPGILQTALLAGVSFLAAYVVDDNTISVGQAWTPPQDDDGVDHSSGLGGVPVELHGIVEGTLWVRLNHPETEKKASAPAAKPAPPPSTSTKNQ